MASPNARIALQSHPTYLVLAPRHQKPWLDHLGTLGSMAEEVVNEEVFKDEGHCLERLNAWGFKEGCRWIVGKNRAKDPSPSWQFWCSYHSSAPKNCWKLEDCVTRELVDGEVKIVSKRKRDTVNRRLGCGARYGLSYRLVSRDSDQREYIGRWIQPAHSGHDVPTSLFDIGFQEKQTSAFRQIKEKAQFYREGSMKYSEARQLLQRENLGVILSQKDYYNLTRHERFKKDDDQSCAALLKALDDAGFKYSLRVGKLCEGDEVVGRKLVQIVFWLQDGVEIVQRFCSGHLLQADATFNTNDKKMPLMTSIGLSNEKVVFPVALSYCPGETAESYSFFFSTLYDELFNDPIPKPKVVLTDSSAGMLSAVSQGAIGEAFHQLCNWHVGNAMIVRIRKGGYTDEEMRGERIDNKRVPNTPEGIEDLVWRYIQSDTEATLTVTRQALRERLHVKEQEYLDEYCQSKERQFVTCYTAKLANLGCHSTQSNESFHSVIGRAVHSQMSLEKSVQAIAQKMKDIYEDMLVKETRSFTIQPTGLDSTLFSLLRGKISMLAIGIIWQEYIALTNHLDPTEFATYDVESDYDSCSCEARLRYSLPCRHILIPVLRDDMTAIPLRIVHPRWQLKRRFTDDWLIAAPDWRHSYSERRLLLTPTKADIFTGFNQLIRRRDELPDELKHRFTRQIESMLSTLNKAGKEKAQEAAIPLAQPDTVQKKSMKRKRPTENSRGLTAIEIQGQKQQQEQRQQLQRVKDRAILASREATPSPLRLPSPLSTEPPPSTAPPAMTTTKSGRQRKKTGKLRDAQAAGWVPESQERR